MRRVVLGGLVLSTALAIPAGAAPGDQSSHSSVRVSDKVRAVDIALDSGSVLLRRGSVAAVDVIKHWNGNEPTVSVKVSNGVLQITGNCPGVFNGPLVYVGGLNSCDTDIVVTLPQRALDSTVTTGGPVTLSGFQGTHRLNSGYDDVVVSGTSGPSLRIDSAGAVRLASLRAGTVTAKSGSGNLSLISSTVTGSVTLSTSSGHVRTSGLTAHSLSLQTGSGDLSVDHLRVARGVTLDTSSGNVSATSVVGEQLNGQTGSGSLTVRDARIATPLVLDTSSGDVKVSGVRAPSLQLDTGSGDITVTDATTAAIKADTSSGHVSVTGTTARDLQLDSGSGNLSLVTTTAPTSVKADTSSGNVSVTVPRGAYLLSLQQSSGRLVIDGISPDSRAARRLDLSTGSGDISVLGR